MRTCSICDLTFARPFTLRRHIEAKHPLAAPLPVERRRGFGNQCQTKYTSKQFGKGYSPVKDDDMDRSSEDEDVDLPSTRRRYGNSPNGRQSPDISDDDSGEDRENDTETDTQSDDSDAGIDVKEDDYETAYENVC